MASAILASRNKPSWGEQQGFMRKPPISSPNPNPNRRSGTMISASADRGGTRPSNFISQDPESASVPRPLVSDDDSSFPPRSPHAAAEAGNGVKGCLRFNISDLSKGELRDLKRQLASELEQVRGVMSRIESAELQSLARSSSVAVGFGNFISPGMEKKALAGVKDGHQLPFGTSTKLVGEVASESEKLLKAMMAKCSQICAKLMKPKKSIWFNSPVDVVALGLHDYYNVIKNPMDLGTVKTRLNMGLYPSPAEFAGDVRLTFNNALRYNPQTHEVYKIADSLLTQFEGLFAPAFDKYEKQRRALELLKDNRPKALPFPHVPVSEAAALMPDKHSLPKALAPSPIPSPAPSQPPASFQLSQQNGLMNRAHTGRQPKPKARDPNKRPMSFEEKKNLGQGLESLPHDKMAQVVQIIRKRKVEAMQDGDEIELDIELMDTETLWELDRFLYNCKKMMSKVRKQGNETAGLMHDCHTVVCPAQVTMGGAERHSPAPGRTPDVGSAKKSKKGDVGEEDVDILDDMPPTHYPPVEIEKEVGSSSSDSDSSSSSDSDSDSSSGNSSEDDAQPSCPSARFSPIN